MSHTLTLMYYAFLNLGDFSGDLLSNTGTKYLLAMSHPVTRVCQSYKESCENIGLWLHSVGLGPDYELCVTSKKMSHAFFDRLYKAGWCETYEADVNEDIFIRIYLWFIKQSCSTFQADVIDLSSLPDINNPKLNGRNFVFAKALYEASNV